MYNSAPHIPHRSSVIRHADTRVVIGRTVRQRSDKAETCGYSGSLALIEGAQSAHLRLHRHLRWPFWMIQHPRAGRVDAGTDFPERSS